MFAAVAFDLDNTLIDRDAAAATLLAEVVPPELMAQALRLDNSGYHGDGALFRWLATSWPSMGKDATAVSQWFRRRLPEYVTPVTAVTNIVESIAARFPTALITNGGPGQRTKLARSGLCGLFCHTILSCEVGLAKPNPAIFAHALNLLAVAPHTLLFVGDHPQNDIVAAKHAGLRTCWLSNKRCYPTDLVPPDFIIDELSQLNQHLFQQNHPNETTATKPC